MLSLMPLLLFFAAAAYALTVARMITAVYEAPVGYEDEAGFHYGIDRRLVKAS